MSTTAVIAIVVAILAILVLVWLIFSRKSTAEPELEERPIETTAPPPATLDDAGDNGVTDAIAAAMRDIAGEMAGVEANPDTPAEAPDPADARPGGAPASTARGGDGDDLRCIKGLGPKAAATLADMGVVRYEQIAAWSAADIDRIETALGAPGRVARDRWVEQAGYLARGDTAGFEENFGKLG